MAASKSFDKVTVVGIIFAVSLLVGGQFWMANRNEKFRKEAEIVAAKAKLEKDEAAKAAAAKNPVIEPRTGVAGATGETKLGAAGETVATVVKAGDLAPAAAKGDAAVANSTEGDALNSDDIVVASDKLELTFRAKGALLSKAVLVGVAINAGDKNGPKGLELLGEIEAGKWPLGLPSFEIGSPAVEQDKDRLKYDQASGVLRSLDARIWKVTENSNAFDAEGIWKLEYSTLLNQKYLVRKTILIDKIQSFIKVEIGVINSSDAAVSYNYTLNGPTGLLLDGPKENPKGNAMTAIVAELAGRDPQQSKEPTVKQVYPNGTAEDEVSYPENIWGALRNRFYMSMLISLDATQLTKIKTLAIANNLQNPDKRKADPNEGIQAVRKRSEPLEALKGMHVDHYALYMGPAHEASLLEVEKALSLSLYNMSDAVHYCDIFHWEWPRVDWVARKLMVLFTWLYSLFGNYGIAVILMTLCIKGALHPIQRKSMISMAKMQKLKPEIDKVQAKYKGQSSAEARQKMMQETQSLYSRAGISPISGCLPMFLQIPIFSALYAVFSRAFEIRGAEFLWIKDLSQQDALFNVNFWPYQLNFLPVVYVVMTIIQQFYISPPPKTNDPQQESTRKMMMFMPLMFSIMFYRMPAGLILYFAVQSIFGMAESWYIKKFLIHDDPFATGRKDVSSRPPPAVVSVKSV